MCELIQLKLKSKIIIVYNILVYRISLVIDIEFIIIDVFFEINFYFRSRNWIESNLKFKFQ